RKRSQVAFAPVAVAAGDDELLHRPRPGQADRLRLHDERDGLANDRGGLFAPGRGGGSHRQDQGHAEPETPRNRCEKIAPLPSLRHDRGSLRGGPAAGSNRDNCKRSSPVVPASSPTSWAFAARGRRKSWREADDGVILTLYRTR